MVVSAKTAYVDRRSADYGLHNGPVSVEMREVRGRKRAMVDSFRNSGQKRIEATDGLDLIVGEASFTGSRTLAVRTNGGEVFELDVDNVFIKAGARPANPPIEGLDNMQALNSTSIMELDVLPQHLLVLGGSYVGLEFAQMFRRFGSEVTVVQRGGQLMGREDPDVAEAAVETCARTVSRSCWGPRPAAQDDNGKVLLTVDTSEGERTLEGSHLLDAAGIETDVALKRRTSVWRPAHPASTPLET
jgi:pyruvate/2-oxoglutarate dehydrogenase complex dihydrolipoamide dehydrogenase (E3) component